MKKTALLMIALLSVNAFATPIPYGDFPVYAKALSLALKNHSLGCDNGLNYRYHYVEGDVLSPHREGDIKYDGTQPLFTFTTYRDELGISDAIMQVARFSTSPDFKVVTLIEIERFRLEDFNTGDLQNPVIVSRYVKNLTTICK